MDQKKRGQGILPFRIERKKLEKRKGPKVGSPRGQDYGRNSRGITGKGKSWGSGGSVAFLEGRPWVRGRNSKKGKGGV